jgi:hypothetical protein
MYSQKLNHMRLQQAIIVFLGVLSVAVLLTSCANAESCSAYQEIELPE